MNQLLTLLYILFSHTLLAITPCLADQNIKKLLRIGFIEEPETLNPAYRSTTVEGYIHGLLIRSLAHYNTDSNLTPHLAVAAPKYKKNTLEFEIKKNAQWGDGTAVTCLDFQTGFLANKKFRKPTRPTILGVEWSLDNFKKCRVEFNTPEPIYTLYMWQPLPTHLEKSIIENSTDEIEYLNKTNYAVSPQNPGLYNGPYRLSVYKPGYYFELVTNENFYGKKSAFEKIQIRFFKDTNSLINAYRSQEIDLIYADLPDSRLNEVKKIIQEKKINSIIRSRATTKLIHLEFNLEHTFIKDLPLRQAMSLMIDQNELKQIIAQDGELTGSIIHKSDPSFSGEFTEPSFSLNRKQAMKILTKDGYTLNSENILGKNKSPVEINLVYNSESVDRERVALYLADKWSSLGIKVNVKKFLKRVLISEILKKGNFDVVVFGWSMPKQQININFYTTGSIPLESNNWTGHNYARWKNLDADTLILKAKNEFNPTKRKKLMHEFQNKVKDDKPWLPLYFQNLYAVVPRALQNYTVFPDWEPESYEVEHWID